MFDVDALLALGRATPFVPFRFILSDGGTVDVVSREMVIPGRNFALVGIPERTRVETVADRWTTVRCMRVSRTEMLAPGHPPFTAPAADTGSPTPA